MHHEPIEEGWTARSLEAVSESFALAADAAGGASLDRYRVGGAVVALRFAGAALRERLSPAFAHLAVRPEAEEISPSLTIQLWDSASTGTQRPPLPPTGGDDAPGALYHFVEPPLRAAYQPALRTLSILDSDARLAWYWTESAFEQPSWDQACPIRQILFWWLRSRGYLQLHGAAVGTPSAGVLIVGKAGAGKSTVALASLGSELLYAGDDYVAVTLEPSPQVASLYSSGKLDPPHLRQFLPHLLPVLANADRLESEKAIVYVHQHFPDQTTAGFPLAALLVPSVAPGQPKPLIAETSRAAAFAALAPSTMFQLHTAGSDELAAMSSLIARVPCYRLEFGTDVTALPATICQLLSDLSSG